MPATVEHARRAVIGMHAVAPPRIVAEHHVGSHAPDHAAHRARAIARSSSSSPSTKPQHLARRRRRAPRPRRAAPARGASTSAARSASPSHVPLEPSVQDAEMHGGAGVGPLREGRAAAELDVVGMRADREHTRGSGEVDGNGHALVGARGVGRELGEIGGRVDVERERGIAHDLHVETEAPRFGFVAGGRSRAVGEGEVDVGRQREHGIAVVAMVGNDDRDRRGAVAGDGVEASWRAADRRARRRHARARARVPSAARRRPRHRGCRDRRCSASPSVSRPRDDFGRARDDDDRSVAGRGDRRAAAMSPASAARTSSRSATPSRSLPSTNDRTGDHHCDRDRGRRHEACVCYRRGSRLFRGEGRVLAAAAVRIALDDRGRRTTSRHRVRCCSRATTSRISTR